MSGVFLVYLIAYLPNMKTYTKSLIFSDDIGQPDFSPLPKGLSLLLIPRSQDGNQVPLVFLLLLHLQDARDQRHLVFVDYIP